MGFFQPGSSRSGRNCWSDVQSLGNSIFAKRKIPTVCHTRSYYHWHRHGWILMLSNGELRHVGAKIEGDDHPSSQSLIDLLTETFQKETARGRLRAAEYAMTF
jgi:hypothetical protein